MTALHGANLIAGEESASGAQSFQAIAHRTGEPLKPLYPEAIEDEIDRAGTLAPDCVGTLTDQSPARIGELLESIASEIEALRDDLIERAAAEAALRADRLKGERDRSARRRFNSLPGRFVFRIARRSFSLPSFRH
jgi:2,5-dioxopentanoate dehydrogenase